jgi:hypothetical protein
MYVRIGETDRRNAAPPVGLDSGEKITGRGRRVCGAIGGERAVDG